MSKLTTIHFILSLTTKNSMPLERNVLDIGNTECGTAPLENPVNDVRDIARTPSIKI